MNFYWNGHTHCFTVYGCFHTAAAELSSYNRDHMAYKAQTTYYLAFLESSLTSHIDDTYIIFQFQNESDRKVFKLF